MKNYLPRSRMLVTGDAGFLASHLFDRFVTYGHHVISLDNCFAGTKDTTQHVLRRPHNAVMRHEGAFPLFAEVTEIFNLADAAH